MMITNKKFQPRQFLLQVHKHTAYNDLVSGEERLRRGVDQRAEALKSLVHQNFDRFVSAKNTIDHVYEEMKSKQLNEQQKYGTIDIQRSLDGNFLSLFFFFYYKYLLSRILLGEISCKYTSRTNLWTCSRETSKSR